MLHVIPASLAVAALLMAGCALEGVTAPPPVGDAAVATSASSYTLQGTQGGWAGEIDFAFTNVTGQTISLLNCRGGFGVRLEKREGGEWVPAWHPVLLQCLSPPIELRPGETHHHTLHVFAGRPGSNRYPQFEVDRIDGTYRLVVGSAYWDYDHDGPPWGEPVPLEHRVSNTFEIRAEG